MPPIQRIAVVGGGSAGFLSALGLKTHVLGAAVTVVKSEKIPIIGVGEATTLALPVYLRGYLGLDIGRVYREARVSWKEGVRLYWGKRDYFDYTFETQFENRAHGHPLLKKNVGFYCYDDLRTLIPVHECMERGLSPILRGRSGRYYLAGGVGYHIENETFVGFLEKEARARGVEVVSDTIARFTRGEDGSVRSLVLESGAERAFDLFVDCSGFRSRLLGEEMKVPYRSFKSSLFCNRAVVGGWMRPDDVPARPYTGALSMSAGWTFIIDHWDRTNVGYVFSSDFISDEDAEKEFRKFGEGRLGATRFIPYVTGRYERAWEKNVVAIGNSCGFVEPLQSTGLHMICDMSRYLASALVDSDRAPTDAHVRHFNRLFALEWDEIRRFLAMHYKLNDRYDTPFWRAARADTNLAGGEEVLEAYRRCGPSSLFASGLDGAGHIFGWDGMVTLMMGMRAPTLHDYTLTDAEKAAWAEVLRGAFVPVDHALTMPEAYKLIMSPGFDWSEPGLAGA